MSIRVLWCMFRAEIYHTSAGVKVGWFILFVLFLRGCGSWWLTFQVECIGIFKCGITRFPMFSNVELHVFLCFQMWNYTFSYVFKCGITRFPTCSCIWKCFPMFSYVFLCAAVFENVTMICTNMSLDEWSNLKYLSSYVPRWMEQP